MLEGLFFGIILFFLIRRDQYKGDTKYNEHEDDLYFFMDEEGRDD